jgi:hypothetical protein
VLADPHGKAWYESLQELLESGWSAHEPHVLAKLLFDLDLEAALAWAPGTWRGGNRFMR